MSITILQWNLIGFRAQRPHLQTALDNFHPQVIALQETHLKQHQHSHLRSYHPLRCDRQNRPGGGVALFIHNTVPHIPIPLSLQIPLEAVAARCFFDNQQVTLCSLYIPPDFDNDTLHQALTSLVHHLPPPVVITTDANAHHQTWGSPTSDRRGHALADWADQHALITLNSGEPTYLSSTGTFTHIDVTFCSPEIAHLFHWQPHHDSFNSDHFPLLLSTDLSIYSAPPPPRWNMQNANWPLFQTSLDLPTNFLSPTQACGSVTTRILEAAKTAIPQTTTRPQHKYSLWWNADCTQARREKNRALTRYKNHLGDLNRWIAYKRARAIFRHTIATAQRECWENSLKRSPPEPL